MATRAVGGEGLEDYIHLGVLQGFNEAVIPNSDIERPDIRKSGDMYYSSTRRMGKK